MSVYYVFSTSVVTIGFNRFYSVSEDAGSISIVVLVLMNCLARDVVVTLSTLDDTARGRFAQCLTCMNHYYLCTYTLMYAAGMDYTSVSRNLTFNADLTIQVVEVPIVDDHIVEQSEIINLTLVSTDSAVILNPSTSTITIEDVDSKSLCKNYLLYILHLCKYQCNVFSFTTLVVTIGFNETAYSVSEDAGNVSVTLFVETGTLDRDVIVTLSTTRGTAMCEFQLAATEKQHP